MITEIDVKEVLSRSVRGLHHDLVTRSTGAAVRTSIEAELSAKPDVDFVVLDFSAVRVLDCSCADEIVAKLLLRFTRESDAPGPVVFIIRGLAEEHAEEIDQVLRRHQLALVAVEPGGQSRLLGAVEEPARTAWERLVRHGSAAAEELARDLAWSVDEVRRALEALLGQRLVTRDAERYHPLTAA